MRAVLETYGTRQDDLQPASRAHVGVPGGAELRALLERHAGNLAGVARELGKDRAQVHRWVRAAGIDPNAYRK